MIDTGKEEKGMKSVFEHDATPTWSGFTYQGHIAIYLALHKICELLSKPYNLDKRDIAAAYQLEVENWEDVAIIGEDGYLSIHQVKNMQETKISAYRIPLTQLMLENGYMRKNNMGVPTAYLHISNPVDEDEDAVRQALQDWQIRIIKFYDRLRAFAVQDVEEDGREAFHKEICDEIGREPISLKRSSYESLLLDTKKRIEQSDTVDKTKDYVVAFLDDLEKNMAIDRICDEVKLYRYDDGGWSCRPDDIYSKIVEQVRRYRQIAQPQTPLIDAQYEYIADKLLSYMRKHILERHRLMQEKRNYSKQFSFGEIIEILDKSLDDYEEKANIEALRRIYDEALFQYCRWICGCREECEEKDSCECRLLNAQYSKVDLDDEDFIKMCFGFNPDCTKTLNDRCCLNELLKRDGLQESVFEVLRKIPDGYFMQKNNRIQIVINDLQNNALLTAISSNNARVVVAGIVGAINKNAAYVSPVFDADELITGRLQSDDESVWNNDFSNISEKYMTTVTDKEKNSICRPKKPIFVKAEEIIKRLN